MITRLILDRNVSKLVATSVEPNLTPACFNLDSIIRENFLSQAIVFDLAAEKIFVISNQVCTSKFLLFSLNSRFYYIQIRYNQDRFSWN